MKVIRAFCLCWLLMLADGVSAQLVDKVLSVLGEDSVGSVTVARTDLIRFSCRLSGRSWKQPG